MLTHEDEQTLIHRLSQYNLENHTTGETYDLKNILAFIRGSEQQKHLPGEPSKLDNFLKSPENILQIPTREFSQIKETLSALGYQFNETFKNERSHSTFEENEALLFSNEKTMRPRWSSRSAHSGPKRPGIVKR